MLDVDAPSISILSWLLTSGGIILLAFGAAIGAIAVVFIVRPKITAGITLVFISFLPGLIGLTMVYAAAVQYFEMAASPTSPKPSEFALVTGRAFSSSFCGLLGSLLAQFLAVVALIRACKVRRNLDKVPVSHPLPH